MKTGSSRQYALNVATAPSYTQLVKALTATFSIALLLMSAFLCLMKQDVGMTRVRDHYCDLSKCC